MKVNQKKLIIYSLIVVSLVLAVGFGSRHLIFSIARKKLDAKIDALRQEGFEITYDSIYSSAWSCNFCVRSIHIRFPVSDTSCQAQPTEAYIKGVEVQGMDVLPLVLSKKISLGTVRIDNPVVHYSKPYRPEKKNDEKKKVAIKGFSLDSLIVNAPDISFYDSASCEVVRHFAGDDLGVTGINLAFINEDSVHWSVKDMSANGLLAELPRELYNIHVKKIGYLSASLELRIDSAILEPAFEKMAFVRKVGHQTDRISCAIPQLVINEFNPNLLQDSRVEARFVKFSMAADVYRDKRFARIPRKPSVLPVKFLRRLPLSVRVDSVEMSESIISYEEFPEEGKGTEAGKISFEKLSAKIYNITNQSPEPARMKAKAMLLGAGSLAVDFDFPAKADGVYKARGSLRNFPMTAINPMLTPLAHAEVKNGTLNEMTFSFQYNEYRADGDLMMDYKDLELISLKKDEDKKNKLLSFLLGLFVKKDLDKDVAVDKKTGTILYYRDDQRAIFNYWWKSLLSGVKSVYNVDKLTNADGKPDPKKK